MSIQKLIGVDATREQIEDWCRAQARAVPVDDYLLCRVLGKHLMYVHQRDTALTPHLALNGIWEPWITMAIARHVKPGMRCLDIGSCYGYYALLLADLVGKDGYVQAWEPYWGELLKRNIVINGANVEAAISAMGTHYAWLLRSDLPQGWFNAGDLPMHRLSSDLHRFRTSGAPVLRPESGSYDFIKIDVEGSEDDVWDALKDVRDESPNLTVCMEFTPGCHAKPFNWLESIRDVDGFDIATVGHDGIPRPIPVLEAVVPDTGDFRMLWLTKRER